MRQKSDLYRLMARQEEARKAAALADLRKLHDAHAQAEHLTQKLRGILAERQVSGPVLAADLRSASTLNSKIAAEAANQSAKAQQLATALDESRSELAKQSHKARFLDEAAAKARREEAETKQALADASRPTRLR